LVANKKLSRGERVCAFIERYCIVPEGMLVGQKLKLAPFQRKFILEVYDNPHGTGMGILSMPRKNSKTATIACLLLAHIAGPEAVQNSRIISGARSREQAGEVYNYASKMVQMSPELSDVIRIVPSGKKLIGLTMNVEYQAISAEGKTAHGKSPIVAILDEVGQVQGSSDDFIDAIITAQGAYDAPLLLAISTQAATDADLFSIWIDDALESDDPTTVCHVYKADDDCDVLDKKQWHKSNPALGMFLNEKKFEEMAERAARMPSFESTFRNLHLNQRVQRNNPFVSRTVWQENGALPDSLSGVEVTVGLDLSARTDLTAAVIVFTDGEGITHVYPQFWIPEAGLHERVKRDKVPYDLWADSGLINLCAGATIDYEFVIRDLCDLLQDCHIKAIAFDRWRIDIFKKDMERMGVDFPMIPHGQGFRDMSPALDALEAALLNKRIRHGNHPVLTMCAANAVETKDPAGNRKLDKSKATGRIDGMVALAMAMSNMKVEEEMNLDDFLASPVGVY
jgi:phage terminase large subunit-like protein